MKRAYTLKVSNPLMLKEIIERYISSCGYNLQDMVVLEWYRRSSLNKPIIPHNLRVTLKLSEVMALKEVLSRIYVRLQHLSNEVQVEILNWFDQLQTIFFNEGERYHQQWKTA